MVIEQITVPDDYKTAYGLRCTVTFRQIFTATVSTIKVAVSGRSDATESTSKASVAPTAAPGSLLSSSVFQDQ